MSEKSGITPADAGKTKSHSASSSIATDHPRGCGENFNLIGKLNPKHGSPPRMRGKQERAVGIVQQSRITPADAGKTAARSWQTHQSWDHPRGCGENMRSFGVASVVKGSPPRMRGKRLLTRSSRQYSGITPADAGKTKTNQRTAKHDEDHPRGCGENLNIF